MLNRSRCNKGVVFNRHGFNRKATTRERERERERASSQKRNPHMGLNIFAASPSDEEVVKNIVVHWNGKVPMKA